MVRDRRSFTDEFKQQMVTLFNNGKPRAEIIREYDLTPSAFNGWVKRFNQSGSFKIEDTRTDEQKELIAARKELQQLRMGNDIRIHGTLGYVTPVAYRQSVL